MALFIRISNFMLLRHFYLSEAALRTIQLKALWGTKTMTYYLFILFKVGKGVVYM
jgi:hypothetical protein